MMFALEKSNFVCPLDSEVVTFPEGKALPVEIEKIDE